MKKLMVPVLMATLVFLTACGSKTKADNSSADQIVEEVSKALQTVQPTKEAAESEDQIIADKLFEISNWLTMDIWNDGFCDISHYIGRGTNAVGGELDLDYTLHKLDIAMEKSKEYNDFIVGLEDVDRYKELKYIWTEKLYPEMNSLYSNITENKPEPNDSTSTYNASKFSTYDSDFKNECRKIRDEIENEVIQ